MSWLVCVLHFFSCSYFTFVVCLILCFRQFSLWSLQNARNMLAFNMIYNSQNYSKKKNVEREGEEGKKCMKRKYLINFIAVFFAFVTNRTYTFWNDNYRSAKRQCIISNTRNIYTAIQLHVHSFFFSQIYFMVGCLIFCRSLLDSFFQCCCCCCLHHSLQNAMNANR